MDKRVYLLAAIGLVVMGISASLVLGLPIGVSMGHVLGWRSPFMLNLGLALLLLVLVKLWLGDIAIKAKPTPFATVWRSLGQRRVLFAHLTTFFFLAGHFSLYGYLTPFVSSQLAYSGALITLVYFIYGIAAVTGGSLAGYFTDRFSPRRTLLTVIYNGPAGAAIILLSLLTALICLQGNSAATPQTGHEAHINN